MVCDLDKENIVENRSKVLLIDGNEQVRSHIAGFLKKQKIEPVETSSAKKIIGQVKSLDQFALIILNLNNNHMYDLETLLTIRGPDRKFDICVLGLDKKPDLAVTLIQQGAIDHVGSIANIAGIYASAKNAIDKRQFINDKFFFSHDIKKLSSKHQENQKQSSDLEEIYDSTLENLMTALDIRDVETYGHSGMVAKYSNALAEILGIRDKKCLDNIRKGALLHDIGKIAIPDSILKKPGSLSPGEWIKIRLHPVLGFGLIKEIKLVNEVGNIILHHHERYDGTGYPNCLKGKLIPKEARIFAVADALDAITSHRPYRGRQSFTFARKEILENAGTQFDPVVVDAFSSMGQEKWEKIRFETTKILPSFEEMIKISL